MKSTIEYIDAAIAKGKFKNDAQFATAMKWANSAMSKYRKGERVISTRHALQLAAYLNLSLQDAVRLITLAETERSGQLPLDVRDFFARVALWIGYIGSAALIAGVNAPAEASMRYAAQEHMPRTSRLDRINTQFGNNRNPLNNIQIMHIWDLLSKAIRRLLRQRKAATA